MTSEMSEGSDYTAPDSSAMFALGTKGRVIRTLLRFVADHPYVTLPPEAREQLLRDMRTTVDTLDKGFSLQYRVFCSGHVEFLLRTELGRHETPGKTFVVSFDMSLFSARDSKTAGAPVAGVVDRVRVERKQECSTDDPTKDSQKTLTVLTRSGSFAHMVCSVSVMHPPTKDDPRTHIPSWLLAKQVLLSVGTPWSGPPAGLPRWIRDGLAAHVSSISRSVVVPLILQVDSYGAFCTVSTDTYTWAGDSHPARAGVITPVGPVQLNVPVGILREALAVGAKDGLQCLLAHTDVAGLTQGLTRRDYTWRSPKLLAVLSQYHMTRGALYERA